MVGIQLVVGILMASVATMLFRYRIRRLIRSRKVSNPVIVCQHDHIIWDLQGPCKVRYLGGSAAEVPVKFQSDRTTLLISRFRDLTRF